MAPPRWRSAAGRQVAAESVAMFRITFGLLVAFGSVRFLAKGWVDTLYLDPEHHLTYAGFEWVRPLPAPWMHLEMVGLAAAGLAIAAGHCTRTAAALFAVGFVHTELIDASLYLNHYWYVTLVALLLVVLPTGRHWSLDARRGRVPASATVPAAVVWVFRAQLAVVYGFAGIAKLNTDWLVHALPMRLWLADRTDVAVVGPLLDEVRVAQLASWAGAAFDLGVVPALLWRRTRPWAYGAVIVFHLSTGALFRIGVFPWVMILGTLVFFDPDWPSRALTRLGRASLVRPHGPGVDTSGPRLGRPTMALLGVLALVELALPLRHLAMPGDVRWTEEGYYLSWRVMLTEKAGHLEFRVTDPSTGVVTVVGPDVVLTDWQATQAAIRPDLLWAAAHLVADEFEDRGIDDAEVRADSFVSMNGRRAQRLVDPTVDLAAESRSHAHVSWILQATPD